MDQGKIDFIDLRTQQQRIRTALERRFLAILDHGQYILGPEVRELEAELARYAGVKHCISCASGTDALLMPLLALGVVPGDAVFVPSFTFVATAEVVSLVGATPVFVDVREDDFNMDAASLREAIRGAASAGLRPRGIIAVDLFGQCADFDLLNEIANEHDLFLIEDAAQSFGARYKGRPSCSLAPIAATSFFPAKPLGCYGDGGAIFLDDDSLAETLLSIRVHGQGTDKYDNVRIGLNGRMDTLQAAVVLEKLTIFDEELTLRDQAAQRYGELLGGKYTIPQVHPERTSSWAQYTLRAPNRAELLNRLSQQQIPTAIYYPTPLHRQTAYKHGALTPVSLAVSERLSQEVFSIPMHPYLTEELQERIARALLQP